jgi:hypothetical protein
VLATGCGTTWRVGTGQKIAEVQVADGDAKKHSSFARNVKAVDVRDLWRGVADSPKDQGCPYNRNAETSL